MQFFTKIFILIVFTSTLLACSEDVNTKTETKAKKVNSEESLIKANINMVKAENEEIDNFVRHHEWEMIETGSGLRYQVYDHGSGPLVVSGQIIIMEYEMRLITGDLIYSSENDGLKSFVIGYGGVESGLEEAVLLLKKGDKAHIILPSHLAYGLLGDQKRIPSRSTLIYEVNILDIKD